MTSSLRQLTNQLIVQLIIKVKEYPLLHDLGLCLLSACSCLLLVPDRSHALELESYRFVRMFPSNAVEWDFRWSWRVAIGLHDTVYVNYALVGVRKYSPDGKLLLQWGFKPVPGTGIVAVKGLEADEAGYVYVAVQTADGKSWIQKFRDDGEIKASWQVLSLSQVAMNADAIAVDSASNLYVVDSANKVVLKYANDRSGSMVPSVEFKLPQDHYQPKFVSIDVDQSGFIYLVDSLFAMSRPVIKLDSRGNRVSGEWIDLRPQGVKYITSYRCLAIGRLGEVYLTASEGRPICQFTSDGTLMNKDWAIYGQFGQIKSSARRDMATDSKGNLYVNDNGTLQKFAPNGQMIDYWSYYGTGPGMFDQPGDVEIDRDQNVYVADSGNCRIQKFSADGVFIRQWGRRGQGDGEFGGPSQIATDAHGNVYVADWGNNRIQKFTSDGIFITKWGEEGTGKGKFSYPEGIEVDARGDVYVADTGNNRVQKFDKSGRFLLMWKMCGSSGMRLDRPTSLAMGRDGRVCVLDSRSVNVFDRDGNWVRDWHTGFGGVYGDSADISVDSGGYLYHVNSYDSIIGKSTPNSQVVAFWGEIGDYPSVGSGLGPGKFSSPRGLAVASDGKVYVADTMNHRIQVFAPGSVGAENKAIIVAGGGPYPGNRLWDTTQACANYAYHALLLQGYSDDSIFYLSSSPYNPNQDAAASLNKLKEAITLWASDSVTKNLVLYMVDHGGKESFRLNVSDMLSAYELDSWLDTFQSGKETRKVTFIYDACDSGSFGPILSSPLGKERIVIAGAASDEAAYFLGSGAVSFSNYFWTSILLGRSIKSAFASASEALSEAVGFQHPILTYFDGSGQAKDVADLAASVTIGNSTPLSQHSVEVQMVDASILAQPPGRSSIIVRVYAEASAANGIQKVWAVVTPPDYLAGPSEAPVQALPMVDLSPTLIWPNTYDASYDLVGPKGQYRIAVYARDTLGYTSMPKVTNLFVDNPLRRRAVIVAGASAHEDIAAAARGNADYAIRALTLQGYAREDVHLLDGETSTAETLRLALEQAGRSSTQDFVLYMIGEGERGAFVINPLDPKGRIGAEDLNNWLDLLQAKIKGKVFVIYDAPQAASFESFFSRDTTSKNRVLVFSAAADKSASFLAGGDVSFSRYFWARILAGADVRDAFLHAKTVVDFQTGRQQQPVLKNLDPGQGYNLGAGMALGAEPPYLIGATSGRQILATETRAALLWVDKVVTTGTVAKVWAVVWPPAGVDVKSGEARGAAHSVVADLPEVVLANVGGDRFEGTYSWFSCPGEYVVTIYAMDTEGNVSLPSRTSIVKQGPDCYEDDDSLGRAGVIVVNGDPQPHNFYAEGDHDWVKFYGRKDTIYAIAANLESDCDADISLVNKNGDPLVQVDAGGEGEEEIILWTCKQDDLYYILAKQAKGLFKSSGGGLTNYTIEVDVKIMPPFVGAIHGQILDDRTGAPIAGAIVKTMSSKCALTASAGITLSNGRYQIVYPACILEGMSVEATGYDTLYLNERVSVEGLWVEKNFRLKSLDSDADGHPDINDLFPVDAYEWQDFDKDGLGDVADYDDDNDGLPDEWELFHDLNPLVKDDGQDPDGDGVSNIDEYLKGTDPRGANDNMAPVEPLLLAPGNEMGNVPLTPSLLTQPFSDPEGNPHQSTRWQISASSDFSEILFSRDSKYFLTSLAVPELLLNPNSTYYWRVKFFDAPLDGGGENSPWSQPFSFTTKATVDDDTDANGILDDQEVDDSVDLDGNGIRDAIQDDIAAVKTLSNGYVVGIRPGVSQMIVEALRSVAPGALAGSLSAIGGMPYGWLTFRLRLANPGDTAHLIVYLPQAAPSYAKWLKLDQIEFGPVGQATRLVKDYSSHAVFSEDRTRITIELVDGGIGDADGVVNGIIIDSSGLGVGPFPDDLSLDSEAGGDTDDDGSAGGCFVSQAGLIGSKDQYALTPSNNVFWFSSLIAFFGPLSSLLRTNKSVDHLL